MRAARHCRAAGQRPRRTPGARPYKRASPPRPLTARLAAVGSAPSKRAPRRPKADLGPSVRQSLPLRLTVAGGALGLEIYEEVRLDPLIVNDLAWTLPNLRFPIDLSGGVDMFRHRRGELTRLSLRLGFAHLIAYARPRLRECLGRAHAPPQFWPVPEGIGVGLVGELGALAFELHWAPAAQEARWVVVNARGVGRVSVPLSQALRVAETLFGGLAQRRGRVLSVSDLGQRVCRQLAPLLGARAPDAASTRIERLDIDADGLSLQLSADAALPELSAGAVRALELARVSADADDALAHGDVAKAREHYLLSLEQAPRHPELVTLVAQIDAEHGDRGEAALGMLVDCMPATQFGLTGAILLARVGDALGARQAVHHAAAGEVFAPLAAGLWQRLAELSAAPEQRRDALDRAVACAPGVASVRWARLEARIEWGDEQGVLADAESLEAAAAGPRDRHDVLTRAAQRLSARGFVRSAGQLFERALRYLPEDPAATYGLARALLGAGRSERALALLERAIELSEAQSTVCADALVELARLLADHCGDHPQAIARVVQVPASSERYLEALALEGRWRAGLGDLRGASLAFARLRDACELCGRGAVIPEAAAWLTEAALFEQRSLGDVAAAERHLASALRLSPQSSRVRRLYRQTAAALAKRLR
jgi:tetratricopeptide (TPR) repeat protein